MTSDLPDKPLRILIIDDEPDWCETIGLCAEALGHTWKSANNFEEAKIAIKEAEEDEAPFSVATIDMAFEVGRRKTQTPLGKGILRYIKLKHPYIACIMVSGSPEVPHQVLNLRDAYELDAYISKDRFDLDTFPDKIAQAIKRVRPVGNEGDEMVEPATWMNILAGAATVLYTEVGALLKERREARQIKREEKLKAAKEDAKEVEKEATTAPSTQPPLRDEATLMAVLKQVRLQQYQAEIDRIDTLQELIGNSRRTLNDYEIEAATPGLSIEEKVRVRQLMENTKTDIIKYGRELQGLMEKISERKIEV